MTVFLFPLILWWALGGFLVFAMGVLAVFAAIGDRFGARGLAVAFGAIGALGLSLLIWSLGAERRTAGAFLDAWQAESAGYPDGRMNGSEVSEHCDPGRNRKGGLSGNFTRWARLTSWSGLAGAGRETMRFPCFKDERFERLTESERKTGISLVPARIFEADATINGAAARVRIWVAEDTDKVVDFDVLGGGAARAANRAPSAGGDGEGGGLSADELRQVLRLQY